MTDLGDDEVRIDCVKIRHAVGRSTAVLPGTLIRERDRHTAGIFRAEYPDLLAAFADRSITAAGGDELRQLLAENIIFRHLIRPAVACRRIRRKRYRDRITCGEGRRCEHKPDAHHQQNTE